MIGSDDQHSACRCLPVAPHAAGKNGRAGIPPTGLKQQVCLGTNFRQLLGYQMPMGGARNNDRPLGKTIASQPQNRFLKA
jgi:hypothetical protein